MLTKDNLYMQKLKVTMILIQKNKNPTNFGLPKKKKKNQSLTMKICLKNN